ncbi:ATP-binding protein [Alteribacillus sp. HJP-4]|uniref:ATP-binding protein n=1 Tax=Alteribacillus sp. HJP-4 TaxID=2775394 RepID=UPI0035CCCDAC
MTGKWKLFHRLGAGVAILLLAVTSILAVCAYIIFSDSLEDQIGQSALNVAKSVSEMSEIREAFEDDDPSATIQPLAERLRESTGAQFIVVGNEKEIRYSHPEVDRIGDKMVGGDNERALEEGESYVSEETGFLGPSIRGKTPIYNDEGGIIGVVSVGFLKQNVNGIIADNSTGIWIAFLLLVLLGMAGAYVIARRIKMSLFDLEPEEIAQLYVQKEGVLQATHESIIAFDVDGNVTFMNKNAEKSALREKDTDHFIQKLIPNDKLRTALRKGESFHLLERPLASADMVLHMIPIMYNDRITGVVASFHPKNEVDRLNMELSEMRTYSDTLRAQTHEFSNKLFTISGLLQMNKTKQAKDYIQQETRTQQNRIQFFVSNVADSAVAGLLLGKYNQAYEKNIQFTIDPDSSIADPLSSSNQHAVLTAMGNVLDNAFEALLSSTKIEKEINIHFTDVGDHLVIEVDDNGPGIPEQQIDSMFSQRWTTKSEKGHGYGLMNVKEALDRVHGSIYFEESELGGTCVILSVPKKS